MEWLQTCQEENVVLVVLTDSEEDGERGHKGNEDHRLVSLKNNHKIALPYKQTLWKGDKKGGLY